MIVMGIQDIQKYWTIKKINNPLPTTIYMYINMKPSKQLVNRLVKETLEQKYT